MTKNAKDQLNPSKKEITPFTINDKGVYYQPPPKDDELSNLVWLCGKLTILARVRDDENQGHGLWLEWVDDDGKTHQTVISKADLAGDAAAIRRVLLDGGLSISTKRAVREHFSSFLMTHSVTDVARITRRTGWFKNVFVLPDKIIGNIDNEQVILQSDDDELANFKQAGTLEQWRDNISVHCIENHGLVFAISAAFAAPMLRLLNLDGVGFHYRGNSSLGKSTILITAKSVAGYHERLPTWNATSTAIEGRAALHNDCLLCLDEIGQADEKTVGSIAYLLANGEGRGRGTRDGKLRKTARWVTLFISSGEMRLSDVIKKGGGKVKAGQEVRVIDMPADAGKGLGIFNTLPDFCKNGAEFSDYLKGEAKKYHGTAFREYLRLFTEKREDCLKLIEKLQRDWLSTHLDPKADGQVKRVAKYFATVAAAGALASEMGITGWGDVTTAIDAAKVCFDDWIKNRGGMGSQEEAQILKHIRYFLEQHGEARFTPWEVDAKHAGTIYRAGFRHANGDYYVLPETFTEHFCDGFDRKLVIDVLKKHGFLVCAKNGEPTVTPKIPANGAAGSPKSTRCYHIQSKILE